jgi:hypothetical protein
MAEDDDARDFRQGLCRTVVQFLPEDWSSVSKEEKGRAALFAYGAAVSMAEIQFDRLMDRLLQEDENNKRCGK